MKKAFSVRYIFLLVLLQLSIGPLFGQQPFTRKYEETFDNVNSVRLNHRNGTLKVQKSLDKQLKVIVNISLKAESQTEANIVFDHFGLNTDKLGDKVSIASEFRTRNWTTNNGVTRIQFEDGARAKNIRDLNIEIVVYSPVLEKLSIEHKYGPLLIEENLTKDLQVKLYEGKLETSDIKGVLSLDMKYSKAVLGSFGSADLVMYDSKLLAENGGNADLDIKYSEVELKNLGNVAIKSYENKIEFENIGNLVVEDKYSDYIIGNFGNATMDVYESDFAMMNGGNFKAKSKYSEYDIESLAVMNFEFSYEDRIRVKRLNTLFGESKYSNFTIGLLKSKLVLNAYEGSVRAEEIPGTFEEITFKGKYTDLRLPLPRTGSYWLDAKMEYGRFSYPEDLIELDYYFEKGNRLELKGKTKGSTDASPKISISAYEGRVTLY